MNFLVIVQVSFGFLKIIKGISHPIVFIAHKPLFAAICVFPASLSILIIVDFLITW